MNTTDRITTLLELYYSDDEPPTGEELAEAGVTLDELAQVRDIVLLDRDVQRAATEQSARELIAMAIALVVRRPDLGPQ